jgi:hypothetical protein
VIREVNQMSSKLEEHGPATSGEAPPADTEYQHARERAKAIQGLYLHLLVYAVVNAGLFLINWATRGPDGAWWFYRPLLGWSVAVAIHLLVTFVPVSRPNGRTGALSAWLAGMNSANLDPGPEHSPTRAGRHDEAVRLADRWW